MIVTSVVATVAVVAAAVVVGVSFGRQRRRERHEVESMFSSEGDRVWWEERR